MKKYREALLDWQKDYITKALEANGWSIVKTALATGLNRTHLHRFVDKLGIDRVKRPAWGGNEKWRALGRS